VVVVVVGNVVVDVVVDVDVLVVVGNVVVDVVVDVVVVGNTGEHSVSIVHIVPLGFTFIPGRPTKGEPDGPYLKMLLDVALLHIPKYVEPPCSDPNDVAKFTSLEPPPQLLTM